MDDPWQILQVPEVLTRIDAALARRSGRYRGWFLVDCGSAELPSAIVHVRSWLQDPEMERRFRLGAGLRRYSRAEVPPGYGVVFLAGADGQMDGAGYDSLAVAIEEDLLYLVIRAGEEGLTCSDRAGRWTELPPPRSMVAAPLDLEVHGVTTVRTETTLPLRIAVTSVASQDTVLLRLVDRNGFRDSEVRYRLSTGGSVPLGRGALRIDFEPEGASDRLIVTAEDFVPRVEAVRLKAPRLGNSRRFSRRVPVRLHLLFDRTTLDLESWERAFAALIDTSPQVEDGVDEDPKMNWNLQIRRGLAPALVRRLPDLHESVKLDLWWFADVGQPGVAEPDSLPRAGAPFGHPGDCAVERLENSLGGQVFGYASGMDLFDAVDDLLAQVAAASVSAQREQQAVLIVGDSPPPPADERDPIWQQLLERPLRTNARRSSLFRETLETLAGRLVPVGWLFFRSSVPPAGGRDLYMAHYPQYQTLRENTLAALRKVPDLLVESSDGIEGFDQALENLFRQMGARPDPPSRLEIGGRR
jgi:hypothetical protein